MTTTRTITVEHDGRTLYGHIAKIDSTALGWEAHGILTAYLHCSWSGSGIGVGGFVLDKSADSPVYDRLGTAYGLDHIMRLMETVGVDHWEKLPGQQVIVLFDSENTLGRSAVGIAGMLNDEVFIPSDHAASFLADAEGGA